MLLYDFSPSTGGENIELKLELLYWRWPRVIVLHFYVYRVLQKRFWFFYSFEVEEKANNLTLLYFRSFTDSAPAELG